MSYRKHVALLCTVTLIVAPLVLAGLIRAPARAEAATEVNRLIVAIPADSAGTVYIDGMRILPPLRLSLEKGRVLLNSADFEPESSLDPPQGRSEDPQVSALLEEVRAVTRGAEAVAESLLDAGRPLAEVAQQAAAVFRAHPRIGDVWVLPSGALEVTWIGIPGRQIVEMGCSRGPGRSAVAPPESLVIARTQGIARLLRAGNLYAAGVGYRVSLSGGLADSMIAAIEAFRSSSAETLRVGARRYYAFGTDLRRVWEGRTGE